MPLAAEQRVPLPKRFLELGEVRPGRRREPRPEIVQVVPPLCRTPLHEVEVVGQKRHHRDPGGDIGMAARSFAVDEDTPPALGRDLDLDPHLAGGSLDATADECAARAGTDERAVGSPPERAQRREVPDRLEEVRLTGAVVTDEDVHPRARFEDQGLVRAEVPQLEPRHTHGATPGGTRLRAGPA